jgi:hypothetical protein
MFREKIYKAPEGFRRLRMKEEPSALNNRQVVSSMALLLDKKRASACHAVRLTPSGS